MSATLGMMAKVALALGVAKSDIILLETARDTWEEAASRSICKTEKARYCDISESYEKSAK